MTIQDTGAQKITEDEIQHVADLARMRSVKKKKKNTPQK